MMARSLIIFLAVFGASLGGAWAVTPRQTANAANAGNPNAAYNYSYMYPYLNNQMKTDLNPGGVTPSMGANPINAVVRTISDTSQNTRRVVPRTRKTSAARAATNASAQSAASAAQSAASAARSASAATYAVRSATPVATPAATPASSASANGNRRVVPRSARGEISYVNRAATNAAANTISTGTAVSSSRCLADYTECMNGYCRRENTDYNRCYCSSRLAQIEAQYQPAIDALIKQILVLQNTSDWDKAEMNEYWMDKIGQYTGGNSWDNLDSALNSIDWAGTESRVRGQQAFATGHSYCVQHLTNCAAMSANLRDAYRSEISRDCDAYEASLQRMKNVAESIVENYSE